MKPIQVFCNGKKWTLRNADLKDCYGLWTEDEILLVDGVEPGHTLATLFHELTHLVVNFSPTTHFLDKLSPPDLTQEKGLDRRETEETVTNVLEEAVCDTVGFGFAALLRDNPDLVKFIVKLAREARKDLKECIQ